MSCMSLDVLRFRKYYFWRLELVRFKSLDVLRGNWSKYERFLNYLTQFLAYYEFQYWSQKLLDQLLWSFVKDSLGNCYCFGWIWIYSINQNFPLFISKLFKIFVGKCKQKSIVLSPYIFKFSRLIYYCFF